MCSSSILMDGFLRRETRYIEFEEVNAILGAMKIGMLALDCVGFGDGPVI